eukprot:4346949-Pyramimonas_sp.AAC.1
MAHRSSARRSTARLRHGTSRSIPSACQPGTFHGASRRESSWHVAQRVPWHVPWHVHWHVP